MYIFQYGKELDTFRELKIKSSEAVVQEGEERLP